MKRSLPAVVALLTHLLLFFFSPPMAPCLLTCQLPVLFSFFFFSDYVCFTSSLMLYFFFS